jgi:hypothetical protein
MLGIPQLAFYEYPLWHYMDLLSPMSNEATAVPFSFRV